MSGCCSPRCKSEKMGGGGGGREESGKGTEGKNCVCFIHEYFMIFLRRDVW